MTITKAKGFIVLSLLFVSLITHAQELIQVCNEPLNASDCNFNASSPNYEDPIFDYLIYRDTMAWRVPVLGKNPNSGGEDAKVDLLLDIYVPCNNAVNRPVVLFPRANGYSSINSKTQLWKETEDRYFLSELAKKGYVVVRYEWRTYTIIENAGFYHDISPFPNNGNTLDSCAYNAFLEGQADSTNTYYRCHACMVNAGEESEAQIFKSVFEYLNKQDAMSAVGYIQEDPKQIGINADLNKIFIGGMSNGAQNALTAAYLDQSELVSLPYYNQLLAGYGSPFNNGYAQELDEDFKFKGVFALWGGCDNLNYIDESDPTTFMIHGTWDPILPYQTDYFSFAEHADSSHFLVHGSEDIACKLKSENVNFGLISLRRTGHGLYMQQDKCTPDTVCGIVISDMLINETNLFLKYMIWNTPMVDYVKGYNLGVFACPNFIQNEYFIPLIGLDSASNCVVDGLHVPYTISDLENYCSCNSTILLEEEGTPIQDANELKYTPSFKVYPNPGFGTFQIEGEYIGTIEVYSLAMQQMRIVKKSVYLHTLDLTDLPAGIYILKSKTGVQRLSLLN